MTRWNRFLVGTLITIVPEPAIEVTEAVLNVELDEKSRLGPLTAFRAAD